jgi:hypothetical protein
VTPRAGARALAVAAALALAAGCTGDAPAAAPQPEPDVPAEPDGSDVPAEPDGPTGRTEPTDPAPPPAPGADLADCDAEERAAITRAVDGQIGAFADGDYAAALGFATDGFRAGFTPATFEQLIREGFPIAADPASHATGACRTDGAAATMEVTIVSGGGEVGGFTYLAQRAADGTWAIAGAVPTPADAGVA